MTTDFEQIERPLITIVGAGLAGSEAALQLSCFGFKVRVLEQKRQRRTPAQSSDKYCELVCSNSFRGASLTNAVGLLKEEMRRMGSFMMKAAEICKVPAGGALAVDRELFAEQISAWLEADPYIEVVDCCVDEIPEARPLIIATGPLTDDKLATSIAARLGDGSLAYYDAIAPIIEADSIDWDKVFIASRYDKGETLEEQKAYVNCPMNKEQYDAFIQALLDSEKLKAKEFEEIKYFEGCLPIEVMAERGPLTLRFGPMKAVGLDDPRTGRWPYAVVQLRKEDKAGSAYNMVGFQSRMTWGDQAKVFRTIPGLENAEFFRFGAIHRNTFLCSPRHLDEILRLKGEDSLYFAGQITGTEGYVESAAGGLLAAYIIAKRHAGQEPVLPPDTTAHYGMLTHLQSNPDTFQPSNITFAHLRPWDGPRLKKREKYQAMADRALIDFDSWWSENAPVTAE